MRPFAHRDPGPIGATLADDSVVAGLICDGIHVDPVAVRMAWRALGSGSRQPRHRRRGRARIRTRCVEARVGRRHRRRRRRPHRGGVLAGSDLSLDRAVRNLVAFTGCSVPDAVRHRHRDPGSPARPRRSGRARVRCPRRRDGARRRPRGRRHRRRRRGGMEVVIMPTAEDAARVVADVVVRARQRAPRGGARPGDRHLAARRLPPADRRSPGAEDHFARLPRRPARRVRRPAR